MTDTSSITDTHSTANHFPVTALAPTSPVSNGVGATNEGGDEPYTIKCICAFEDDDGSTVFCERCETWQHIVCYYHDKSVPEIHNCAECEPRALDAKRATEQQKRLREQSENGDRKGKRLGSRGQKKKAKEPGSSNEQPNGWVSHQRSGSNASRDNPPPAKKQRTAHRASNSVTSVGGTMTDSRKRSTSTNAPTTVSQKPSFHPQIPLYSQEFLHLYDNDHASVEMQNNLFDTIGLARDLASWAQDSKALAQVANGRVAKEVFTHVDQPLDSAKWPVIVRQSAVDTNVEYSGKHPTWRFLKVQNDVRKDEIVGEVRGKVGHFRDYCLDPCSRWQELRHPEPFVFFHPQLPIYIDSRNEGTELRYIRRSCRPNVTMRTFITNQVEYHFCFVANQDIPMDSEITATWYLDPQMFPSNNGLVKHEDPHDGIPDSAAISISNVLAHFGGCACGSTKPCLLANIDCRPRPKALELNTKQTNGKRRKARSKPVVSPTGTGNTTNSRSGSEAIRNPDDDDNADNRSTSGSLKDQPRSRGLTPTAHTLGDIIDSNGAELSAREKRKIAAAEKKFEQLEHDQQHNQKRKKRTHTARGHSPVSVGQSKSTSLPKPSRLDTASSRRPSASPTKMSPRSGTFRREGHLTPGKVSAASTPRVASPLSRRPAYVDSAMQTDPDENDPQYVPPISVPRPRYLTLSQRLLKRVREDRIKLEQLGQLSDNPTGQETGIMPPPSITTMNITSMTPSPQQRQEDIEMKDADTVITPPKSQHPSYVGVTNSGSISGPPHDSSLRPLPSISAHSTPTPRRSPVDIRNNLRVQLPPSQFQNSIPTPPTNPPKATSPSTTHSSRPPSQSGLPPSASNMTGPSPVKKKLSLGDYMSRRGTLTTTPTTEKTQHQLLPGSHQQPSPASISPAPSSGGSDPTSSQLPFTKVGDSGVKQEGHSPFDVTLKDTYLSPSTPIQPPANKPHASRDPRLPPRDMM